MNNVLILPLDIMHALYKKCSAVIYLTEQQNYVHEENVIVLDDHHLKIF
jgi:hypothetical protein